MVNWPAVQWKMARNEVPGIRVPGITALTIGMLAAAAAYLIYTICDSPVLGSVPPDAVNVYLPLARRLLSDPLAVFNESTAVMVAPGGYVYMALAGAKVRLIFIVNIAFAVTSVVLLFDLCRRLGGWYAGMGAALLYVFSPVLPAVSIPPLNEPPFLFFTLLWLWSMVWVRDRPQRWWPVVLSGLALLASILTRAIYFYWLAFAFVGLTAAWIFTKAPDARRLFARLMMVHLIAGLGAGAYTAHNAIKFGVPMIATGSGTALYFGSNAARIGYEPPYFGMVHDEWMVTDQVSSHLSPENDRRLGQAAKHMLRDLPLQDIVEMYAMKLGAVLFFSKATLPPDLLNGRIYRIVLLVLAGVGIWAQRRNPLAVMCFMVLGYVTAVHVPVMYNQRYSVGALEIPLTVLAGLGVGALFVRAAWPGRVMAALVLIVAGSLLGAWHQRFTGPLMPDLDKGVSKLLATAQPGDISTSGFLGDPFAGGATVQNGQATVTWNGVPNPLIGGSPVVRLEIEHVNPNCHFVHVAYRTQASGKEWNDGVELRHPKSAFVLTFGTARLNNIEEPGGALTMSFVCPPGSTIALGALSLHVLHTGLHYRARVFGE